MKILFSFSFLLLIFSSSQAQSYSSASEYMEAIGIEYKEIKKDTWDYTRAVAHNKSGRKIDKRRQELLSTISKAKAKVKKMPKYKNDGSYRDSVVIYLQMNYSVLNNDYAKIVDMEEIAEQSYDLMEAYLLAQEKADEKLKEAAEHLEAGQKLFAQNNNVTLLERDDETTKKLEKAGAVYKYYNKVYLIFFKCYKQEAYLLDAYNRKDISAMEQSKNQLGEYALEGLTQLRKLPAYHGDKTLLDVAIKVLNFYDDEANHKSTTLIDFYLKSEKFVRVKEALDAKSEKNRTKEDIDRYNSSLTLYNNAINDFNSINTDLNQKRTAYLTAWNSEAQNFTHRHVSKK